ncbi:hypothetical protein M427DRAFT_140235 [Gonapodya prolifera JEL478]|uniref:Uncharacterized protein n=1 Tax=Gonapodya prolifera (strain JEL478) TaxID=1344416 RepID=A0A138ZZH0_GONPJ|nr:hypothetical protein M427DRAFT_140235 [Gonapodya prolifera JEL478]|eukprot:KXS09891.1 hypothetical protein M427DRAFT_140235 [Gonapodya prolifera JEL478]
MPTKGESPRSHYNLRHRRPRLQVPASSGPRASGWGASRPLARRPRRPAPGSSVATSASSTSGSVTVRRTPLNVPPEFVWRIARYAYTTNHLHEFSSVRELAFRTVLNLALTCRSTRYAGAVFFDRLNREDIMNPSFPKTHRPSLTRYPHSS